VTSFRCTLAARVRGDDVLATAPPARRFLLLEVPGPWAVPDAVEAADVRPDVANAIRHRAGAAGARVLLIRRPGRHPAPEPGSPRRWGLARLGSASGAGGVGGVVWGTWTTDDDLLALDPAAAAPQHPGERPLALVCTHGKHDVCCAIEGRPVAQQVAADPRVDAWECSHLGGDRFAANLLWLPSGLLLGGLTVATAAAAVEAGTAGRVPLENYRGRCGDAAVAQAAQWFAMRELGVDRPDLVVVESVRAHADAAASPGEDGHLGESHTVAVVRQGDRRLRVEVAPRWSEPGQLTCRGSHGARARTWRLVDLAELAAAS
jgi:hypothetical protein